MEGCVNVKGEDPIKELYVKLPPVEIVRDKTALLVVDMQYLDAAEGYGVFAKAKELGLEGAVTYYLNRVRNIVVPNIAMLLKEFRDKNMEVLFTKIESLTQDGRDRSLEHKRIGVHAPKGSKEAQILEEIRPQGDEIVIPKTTSGVFNATNIDYVLKNLGIDTLVVCGVVTNECVENAVRDAADRSYKVILIEDCCAALSEKAHKNAVAAMAITYSEVLSTEELVEKVSKLG